MSRYSAAPTFENAEKMAKLVGQVAKLLPEGAAMVMFLIVADEDTDKFHSALAATTTPDVFAPVLREWLARYDRGDAP